LSDDDRLLLEDQFNKKEIAQFKKSLEIKGPNSLKIENFYVPTFRSLCNYIDRLMAGKKYVLMNPKKKFEIVKKDVDKPASEIDDIIVMPNDHILVNKGGATGTNTYLKLQSKGANLSFTANDAATNAKITTKNTTS